MQHSTGLASTGHALACEGDHGVLFPVFAGHGRGYASASRAVLDAPPKANPCLGNRRSPCRPSSASQSSLSCRDSATISCTPRSRRDVGLGAAAGSGRAGARRGLQRASPGPTRRCVAHFRGLGVHGDALGSAPVLSTVCDWAESSLPRMHAHAFITDKIQHRGWDRLDVVSGIAGVGPHLWSSPRHRGRPLLPPRPRRRRRRHRRRASR